MSYGKYLVMTQLIYRVYTKFRKRAAHEKIEENEAELEER